MTLRLPTLVFLSLSLVLGSSCGGAKGETPDAPGAEASSGREIGDGFAEVKTVNYAPLNIPDDAPTVAFLGDSLTAGLHLSPDQAFPAVLQRMAFEELTPFHLVNAGVSGDTTAGGLARLPWLMKNSEPDLVVVGLGANDGLRGVKLEATEANLREIIDTLKQADIKVILLGMNVPTNLGQYAEDFAALYLKVGVELDVPVITRFLDGVGGVPEMNLADGMHPTPEGHVRLAENIHRALMSMLSTESPRVAPTRGR